MGINGVSTETLPNRLVFQIQHHMQETREINALFTLIDDPDEEVYSTVSEKIVAYGKNIIPNLEHLWETTLSADVQERIEMIIHHLIFRFACRPG